MRCLPLWRQFNHRLSTILLRSVTCSILGYKWLISPMLPLSCRFYPTCSEYALLALEQYGLVKGLWLTSKRLLRCHPWAEGGFDPVLPNKEKC